MKTLAGFPHLLLLLLVGAWIPFEGVRADPEDSAIEMPHVEVARVELEGVASLDRQSVIEVLEVNPGDSLDRLRVVRTVENVRELYRVRGFENTRVRAELVKETGEGGRVEAVLKFRIEEGLPIRIASIRVSPARSWAEKGNAQAEVGLARIEDRVRAWWVDRRSELTERLDVVPGDRLDQERLTAGKRLIQESLVSDEWVGSKVDQIRIETASGPARGQDPASASRWVNVEVEVELGDRVTFGFRGNENLVRNRLVKLVDDQRALGLGKDYVEALRQRIEDEYRSLGWAFVRVTTQTFERSSGFERHVTFQIDEGGRVPLRDIYFDGNQYFDGPNLAREFRAHAGEMTRQGWFVERELDQSAESLVTWMRSQGFLAAKKVTLTRKLIRNRARRQTAMDITLWVYEGGQTRVDQVELKGLEDLPREEVLSILGVREGEPLNLLAFNQGIEALKGRYRAGGWLDFKLLNEGTASVIRYSRENRVATILLEAEEGTRWKFGSVEVASTSSIPRQIILRELTVEDGEPVLESELRESESRIRRLGIFSGVELILAEDPRRPRTHKMVRVTLEEGTPGIIAGGIGYRNDLGIRTFGQLGYTNLWNQNHTVALNGTVNRRFDEAFCTTVAERAASDDGTHCFLEYQFQIGYVWPWFVLGPTTFRPRFTFERTQYRNFDADTVSFASTWERRLLDHINLTGSLTYSLERTKQYNAENEVDNQDLTIGGVTPGLRLDLRDSSLAPTRGWFFSSSFEFASPAMLSQSDPFPVGYTRFQGRIDRYIPIGDEMTWFLSFRTGLARNLEAPPAGSEDDARYAIPLIKQFSLGGAGSLRGFADQELNVQDYAIRGTLSYVNYRTQIDLPFAGPMRFGPFIDAGNLLVDQFSFGALRYGVGVGFHYQSPVGPVNFDLGFKVDPKPNEEPWRFYFSIGVI